MDDSDVIGCALFSHDALGGGIKKGAGILLVVLPCTSQHIFVCSSVPVPRQTCRAEIHIYKSFSPSAGACASRNKCINSRYIGLIGTGSAACGDVCHTTDLHKVIVEQRHIQPVCDKFKAEEITCTTVMCYFVHCI